MLGSPDTQPDAAEVADQLVAGLEMRDREQEARAAERERHAPTVVRGDDNRRLRPRGAPLVLVRLQARLLGPLPRIVKSISRWGRDPNALVAELAVHAVAEVVARDRPQGAGADALNVRHKDPVAGGRWRRTVVAPCSLVACKERRHGDR